MLYVCACLFVYVAPIGDCNGLRVYGRETANHNYTHTQFLMCSRAKFKRSHRVERSVCVLATRDTVARHYAQCKKDIHINSRTGKVKLGPEGRK